MKKITFLLLFLMANIMVAQTWTTGDVTVKAGYTVKFDINTGTNLVTMTMVSPDVNWFAVGPGISAGFDMGSAGDDVVAFNSSGLQDRNMTGGTSTPNVDGSQDWTLVSNNSAGGVRTVVGTRPLNTGDSNDFTFPTSMTTLPILWAHGQSTNSFGYHGGGTANKGGVVANVTLSTPDFESELKEFSIYPNPSTSAMNIGLSSLVEGGLQLEVYDVLGKKVYSDHLSTLSSSVDISKWNSGMFLVKLTSVEGNISLTKRFVKL